MGEYDVLAAALAVAGAAVVLLTVALVRTRRRWRAAVGERGWLLERERESAAEAAGAAERDRIARELHDIVSHNVSLMVVQASAAREVLGTMPDEAATALRAVEDAGRGAMTDLRHLLGLLAPAQDGTDTDPGPAAGGVSGMPLTPQPGLDGLGRLVDRISFAGLPVEVRVSGEPRPLPQGIDVTAYRIIQEALTNALRYGDGGKAEVTVRYADQALRVEILNTGPSALTGIGGAPGTRAGTRIVTGTGTGTGAGAARGTGTGIGVAPAERAASSPHAPGAGRGLLGLRERVAVYGGDLDARRRLGGGYRVRARIPLDRP